MSLAKAIMILRNAEPSDSGDPNSGLSERGRESVRGLPRIEKFIRGWYEKIFWVPQPVCEETISMFFQLNPTQFLYGNAMVIGARSELAPNNSNGWKTLIRMHPKKTLSGLKDAQEQACAQGLLESEFLANEGKRVLDFLLAELQHVEDGNAILCVMTSPLIEAVTLKLWQTQIHDICQKWFPLDNIHFLGYCDAWSLVFSGKQLSHMTRHAFSDQLDKLRVPHF